MISPWTVYFICMLDSIGVFFVIVGVILGVLSFVSFLRKVSTEDILENKNNFSSEKKFITLSVIMFLLCAVIPSTKQMATILIIPKLSNSDMVKELPKDLLKLIDKIVEDD